MPINDLQPTLAAGPAAPRGAGRRRIAARVACRTLARLALAALPAAVATPLAAQPILGAGDDATVLRRGHVRLRILGAFESWGDRYDADGTRRPLGAPASFDTLGARFLPALGALQDTLRALTGAPGLVASLGTLRTDVRVSQQTFPLSAEIGVLDRLTLAVVVPFVRNRVDVNPRVNATGAEGNLGFNPVGLQGAGGIAAAQRNAALATQLAQATAALRALTTACGPGAADPRCAGFDPALAARLLTDASAFQNRVALIYGGERGAGFPFVPLVGSAPQRAVEATVAALAGRFAALGVTALRPDAFPAAADVRLGFAGLQQILTVPGFGIAGDSLLGTRLAAVGDVQGTATFQWLDTFRGDERARLAPNGFHVRSAVTAGYRLGTGGGDLAGSWFDVPTGTGASALLVRSATDLVFGRRASATAVVRLARPNEATQILRVPSAAGEFFVSRAREVQVARTLGREVELELTPRLALGEYFGVWGQYRVRDKAADAHRGTFQIDVGQGLPPLVFDASGLDAGTAVREQRAAVGVMYSTLAGYARGRSNLPVEVSWAYQRTIAGDGINALAVSGQQLQVRLYFQLLGTRTPGRSGVR